ncbi:MAG: MerR family DNA-binding transcriptional regulator [Betaproteobacteria bacterium]|nr:MerR family DNA-binding transcriptional regulator [Betaproteobacteria bacterium]
MNIGQAAQASGVSAKMIRHYEDIALLPAARRTVSGYRQYDERDVQTPSIHPALEDLGFSLPETGRLLSLWFDRNRPSREVKALARGHIEALEAKARELLAMKGGAGAPVSRVSRDDRPDCPIIETLAGPRASVAAPHPRRAVSARHWYLVAWSSLDLPLLGRAMLMTELTTWTN